MREMKAWIFERYGPPGVMTLRSRPRPDPGGGELLVKIIASAINPSDVKNVSGHFRSSLPRLPGRDFAGVVVSGGTREGEEVWGSGAGFGVTRDGAHAQYILLPADAVCRKPSNLSMEEAAAIGVPFLTAWSALVATGNVEAGQTVLVTGASGAVGRAATQIAHWKGARVIGAVRSAGSAPEADMVAELTESDLTAQVLALTNGIGVDLVLDVVGGALFEPCLKSLRQGGHQVAIVSNPPVVHFNLVDFYHGAKRLSGVDTMALGQRSIFDVMNQLSAGFEAGALRAPEIGTWPFEMAVEAYEAVARGTRSLKQVLRVG
ncbi:MAG TPA: zinc-binding alcohol dehydrogenase family protein [Anaeromyxobacteraceae bacterium]|nr:zinc-binding alcohol dehydrogenase family protein [Anaeromyxobacteraceae bacterium]